MAKAPTDGEKTRTDNIISEHIDDALSSRYLAYALSTITQRALPDRKSVV